MPLDELYITDLEQANLHFGSKFFNPDKIENLKPGGYVKAVYEEKQEYESKKPLSIILRKEHDNGLGMVDNYYYYLIYRKKPWFNWSEAFNLPHKYVRTPGIYIPFAVLKHIDQNGLKLLSELVLITGDGKIYSSPSEKIFDFFIKNRMQITTNYNQTVTGLPMELFGEIK